MINVKQGKRLEKHFLEARKESFGSEVFFKQQLVRAQMSL